MDIYLEPCVHGSKPTDSHPIFLMLELEVTTSSLPLVFPPLTEFVLEGGVTRGWFSLFKRLEDRISTMRVVAPLSRVKGSLKCLSCVRNSINPIIDVSFAASIRMFRNLVNLIVENCCRDTSGRGECVFELDNDNVAKLAMALPLLEILCLGRPCVKNTCATTVVCLLPISVHCAKLRELAIDFNTANIVDDFKDISANPQLQELRSLPRCTLSCLDVDEIPLNLDVADFDWVVHGMLDIFPFLGQFKWAGSNLDWGKFSGEVTEVQKIRALPVHEA